MRIYPKCPACGVKVVGVERELEELEPLIDPVRMMPKPGFNLSPCGHAMPDNMSLTIRERPIMRVDLIAARSLAPEDVSSV